MTLDDLVKQAVDVRQERIDRAEIRLKALYFRFRGYVTEGLKCHCTNLVQRSLKARDDGSLLEYAVDDIERMLSAHKRRCDHHGGSHATAS